MRGIIIIQWFINVTRASGLRDRERQRKSSKLKHNRVYYKDGKRYYYYDAMEIFQQQ